MKNIETVVKWAVLLFLSFLLLLILAGMVFRLSVPEPSKPMGALVDIGGFKLHINSSGEKKNKPTVVIEGGGGLPTEFGYWLNEHLKDSMRVVRYDRAGIGHSDECITPRRPETVARELHALLKNAGESPPYIMMGHSIGGPYIRVFAELYPDEVTGMVFLDATHPDHIEKHYAPKQSDFKFKGYLWTLDAQAVLSDLGILPLFDKAIGTPYYGEGLPAEINRRFKEFLYDGKSFRGYKQEMKYYHETLHRSGEVEDFGTLPILEFRAVSEDLAQKKLDNEAFERSQSLGTHKPYADLSKNGKAIEIPGNHLTIFTKKENAAIICNEILELVRALKY